MFHKISNHIYMLDYTTETDRPNLAYIQGKNRSIQIDAGNSIHHVELFNQHLKENNLKQPDLCLITHWHWDHTFGISSLSCPSLSSTKTYHKLEEVSKWEWTLDAMKGRLDTGDDIEFCDTHIKLEYPDLSQIHVSLPSSHFQGEITFDLEDVTVKAITTDSPHSRDAVLILIVEDRILFVADADCEDFYHGAVYDKEKLHHFIELVESLDYDTYIVGHSEPETKKDALARLYNTLKQLD